VRFDFDDCAAVHENADDPLARRNVRCGDTNMVAMVVDKNTVYASRSFVQHAASLRHRPRVMGVLGRVAPPVLPAYPLKAHPD
jgi:hypothetical protein